MITLQFGGWRIDVDRNELVRGTDVRRLQPKAMDVLVRLTRAGGHSVSVQELLTSCWPGRVVLEQVVYNRIAELRAVLEDDPQNPCRIITVPGRGYAAVDPERMAAGNGTLAIAVLPFANLSLGTEEDYFSDGVSDEILNRLARIGDIRVIARTSSYQFKGRNEDVREIGAVLNVSHVLEGSVRKSVGRVRIAARLIDTGDGSQVWSETYDRNLEDVFAVQDDVATSILQALEVHFRAAQPVHGTTNPAAYEAYVTGRYFYFRSRFDDAVRYMDQAVDLDPAYADPYVSKASVLIGGAALGAEPDLGEVHAALDKTLALMPEHPGASAWSAMLRSSLDGDHQGALDRFARVLHYWRNDLDVLLAYRIVLWNIRRYDLSLRLDEQLLRLDPLSPNALSMYAHDLANEGRWDDARAIAERNRSLGATRAANIIDVNIAIGSGDLDAMPRLIAESRELFGFPRALEEGAYYIAIEDVGSVANLIEDVGGRSDSRSVAYLSGDDEAAIELTAKLLEVAPLYSTTYSKIVPWPMLQGEASFWPWKHLYAKEGWERMLQGKGLDDATVAQLDVPALPL